MLGSNRASTGAPEESAPRAVDGGLRILIDGGPREAEPPRAAETAPSGSTPAPEPHSDQHALSRALAAVALVGADVALLGWTAYHVVTHRHALDFKGIVVCAGSMLMAAVCGAVAARLIVHGD